MKSFFQAGSGYGLVAEGVANMLQYNAGTELVATYTDSTTLPKRLADEFQPDVLLPDITMPGVQGDELAGLISTPYPRVRILVLTSHDNIFYTKRMLLDQN